MKIRYVLAALSALFIGMNSFAATEVARVNSKVITLDEFNKKYQQLAPLYQGKTPTRKAILDDIIKREVGVQEARRLRLDQDPEVRDEIDTVLYAALLRKQLNKDFENINLGDSEVKSWYERNPEVRTSHIFIAVKPGATKAEEQRAQERLKEIQDKYLKAGNMSFAEVAQKYSEGVAAPMGGDIDYQTKEKLDPAYYSTAVALRSPGKVSGIVRSQYGFHIIKLTGVKEWADVDKAAIRNLVMVEKKQQLFEKYMTALRAKAKVTVNNAAVQ